MVKTNDGHRLPICATCGHPIKNREKGGVYDDGHELHHSDCIRDKHGYDSLLDDRGWPLEERLHSERFLDKYIDTGNQPWSKYGARKIA